MATLSSISSCIAYINHPPRRLSRSYRTAHFHVSQRLHVSSLQCATSTSLASTTDNQQQQKQENAETQQTTYSPLSLTLKELSDELGGSGRAASVWDCLSRGIDPNLYYSKVTSTDEGKGDRGVVMDDSDKSIVEAWVAETGALTSAADLNTISNEHGFDKGQGLGMSAWKKLQSSMQQYHATANDPTQQSDNDSMYSINDSIASLSHMKVSSDGTTKLLLKMVKDGLEVESVIIPWMDKGMGKLRSLTTDEILVQMYYASKICRVVESIPGNENKALPPVDNIVFMGMGEPADNADAVVRAVNTLVDRRMFGVAQSKITISTVAPDPSAFATLGSAPAALAWSVHAVDDSLRRQLVPTTKYSMEELRAGLVKALLLRSNKLRRTMLEVALMKDVNDSPDDARLLSEFAMSIMKEVRGSKIVVNLIPFNDIGHPTYRTPSMERVLEFQKIVVESGDNSDTPVLCYVRTTRGDEESSACGQLATKKTS
eukprot:scaffold24_cov186-Alexandrium_tamarense.AAC.29